MYGKKYTSAFSSNFYFIIIIPDVLVVVVLWEHESESFEERVMNWKKKKFIDKVKEELEHASLSPSNLSDLIVYATVQNRGKNN